MIPNDSRWPGSRLYCIYLWWPRCWCWSYWPLFILCLFMLMFININADGDHTDHCTRVIPYSCWLVWGVLVLRDSGPIHLGREIHWKLCHTFDKFKNLSLRVVHHPSWLEELCLASSFVNKLIHAKNYNGNHDDGITWHESEYLWLHVLFLPKYASVLKLRQALGT